MAIDYVVDTNIFILLFNGSLDEVVPEGGLGFSVITEIELLSFANLSKADEKLIQYQLRELQRVPLDQAVSQKTIALRRQYRLKTPDAIVAASALAMDAVLLTNDQQLLRMDMVKTRAMEIKEKRDW